MFDEYLAFVTTILLLDRPDLSHILELVVRSGT